MGFLRKAINVFLRRRVARRSWRSARGIDVTASCRGLWSISCLMDGDRGPPRAVLQVLQSPTAGLRRPPNYPRSVAKTTRLTPETKPCFLTLPDADGNNMSLPITEDAASS